MWSDGLILLGVVTFLILLVARRFRQENHRCEAIDRPGGAVQLPFVWPESRAQSRGKPKEPPPIVKLLQQKPWLLLKFMSGQTGE